MAARKSNRAKFESPEAQALAAAISELISSSREMKKTLQTINESVNAQTKTLLQGIQEIADSKEQEQ